ncbi:SDR family NAD(P)-dependent oxidoreductase [Nocardia sp. NPDC050408]|uniref:SDR family NAD(P)-dependent oxidoreductase n=1 Tax=Nocardia sp. NPDC050408 TaxID=3364319 RepID=UPI00379D38B4
MPSTPNTRDLVVVVTPFTEPNAALVVAVERAGGLGVLDLGRRPDIARAGLADVCRWWTGPFGVRVPSGCDLTPADLPDRVDTIVLPAPLLSPGAQSPWRTAGVMGKRLLAEVVSLAEASTAVAAGAHGLIVRGCEAGGRVGELTTFVLLQQLLSEPRITVPVWAAGGIGVHSAAAAIAGGAVGVVLDAQLALVAEMDLPPAVAAAIRAMDGSETAVVGGHRIYVRPDLPVAGAGATEPDPAARLGARDLRTQLLPVGQEGAVAAGLAQRYVTAAAVVQAVRASVAADLNTVVERRPLAAGAVFAAAHGLRYPVAQGPMTHVSDKSAFAAAVADAGGLPFLALSLLSGEKTKALLEQTAALLGDAPWGAGILGFVPGEVRDAQMEAIFAIRPPYALIAGGRPSQGAELEAAGIPTFLHVPSPGLLDQFLAQGSRRFVFEGRECGGHVGPRSSFALWDVQVEHLLAFGERAADERFFEDLQILFAGGIHDERSAAMAAALGAPLVERGAGIGVLMGTAYLFTEEAVAAGAIMPTFQQAALQCDGTVLLETSPGHSTRCADSPYVRAFQDTKRQLVADRAPQQQMWAQLEQLNLGRLRIASKGLRREGEQIVPVGEDIQRADGMVMIGDVAALRSATTTMPVLHSQVSEGATGLLGARAAELGFDADFGSPRERAAAPLDVAIIGMAGVFPEAGDLARYWTNIVSDRDTVTEVSPDRWDPELYYDPEAVGHAGGRKTPSKWGGFLPDVPFDALEFGIPPASLAAIEPVQLLALEVAARALRDAGYRVLDDRAGGGGTGREFDRERVSVVFGTEAGTDLGTAYGFRSLFPSYFGTLPEALDAHLPALTEDSFPGVLGNVLAGRIANRLDLGGVNYTVDAACASSLAALDTACKELQAGTSDMVLCGGADTHNGICDYLLFAAVGALSKSGRCRTFDGAADGIALGEGVGCVVLKRLTDAERDGDHIVAVIKGLAGSSDGRSRGLTAPRPEGQRLAMERAYRMAGVSPARLGLMEAHGTGTIVGDRTELSTLTTFLTEAGAPAGACALGSVKSQIGHTKCAAGLASLIKAARAVHAGVRPPTGNLQNPNGYWQRENSPFFFDTAARPWCTPAAERIAGVSAFGFGGTNFHAVVAGYGGAPEPAHGLDEWPAELFLFRGVDQAEAVRDIDRLAELIAANDAAGRPWRLRDLALTAERHPSTADVPVQVALVAGDLDELAEKLELARAFQTDTSAGLYVRAPQVEPGQVAFLFPGQGSQRVGMLADLFVAFPRLRTLIADDKVAGAMFPPAAFSPEDVAGQRAALADTRVAQRALGAAGIAMHQLLTSLGVRPDAVAGHSYGELVALYAAGVFDADELLDLSIARGEAIHAAAVSAADGDPGAMAAVAATPQRVRAVFAGNSGCQGAVVANHNAPAQTVISGPTPAIEAAIAGFGEIGLKATKLQVACAFHSPVVAGAGEQLAADLGRYSVAEPSIPVWSNTTASPYPGVPGSIRAMLMRQLAEPVRFADQIEAMYDSGIRVFVEAGPGRVLTGLVGQILAGRPHTAVACDVPGEPGLRRLLLTIGELAVAGVPVDLTPLFHGRDATTVSTSSVARRPGWIVNGHLIRTAAGEYLPGAFKPARELAIQPIPAAGRSEPDRDGAVLEYLRSTREVMGAQRDVMLAYLGAPLPAPPAQTPVPIEAPALVAVESAAAVTDVIPVTPERALDAVRKIVSERTGYPEDMLQADLDLEGDLSIDSIKRIEIVGALQEHTSFLGFSAAAPDESVVEELAQLKTLRAIVDWLLARVGESLRPPAPSEATTDSEQSGSEPPAAASCSRYVVRVAPLPPPGGTNGSGPASLLAGRRFAIINPDHGVSRELAGLLRRHGAEVLLSPDGNGHGSLSDADTVVHLGAIALEGPPVLPGGFGEMREVFLGGAQRLLVVTAFGGRFGQVSPDGGRTAGLGLHGLVRTIAQEFPELVVRAVDVDPTDAAERIAAHLLAELLGADEESPVVVGYRDGERVSRRIEAAPLERVQGAQAERELGLNASSVVLLTGGARGITAKVAIGLARASGCRIELLGRTPQPIEDEDPATADAPDSVALRRAVIELGTRAPAEVEVRTRQLLVQREIRSTMAELNRYAASVCYHAVDVRDPDGVRGVVENISERHGRLDGVIHGAGVLDDRMLRDKSPEGFERVYSTKVDGAKALADAVDPDHLAFLVLFGSVSGVYGNRGQVDYAAANDALDTLAHIWAKRFTGRVVSVDWGPWTSSGGGMVSAELLREYSRRGIEAIDPDEGVACLLRELAQGDSAQVVYLCGSPEAYGADSGAPARLRRNGSRDG